MAVTLDVVRTYFEYDGIDLSFESTWEGARVLAHSLCEDRVAVTMTYGLFRLDDDLLARLDSGALRMHDYLRANVLAKVVVNLREWPWPIVSHEAVTELPADMLCTPDAEWFTRWGQPV